MRSGTVAVAIMGLVLAACGPQTPEQARIDNIQDAAEAEADTIESAAKNQIGLIEAQAETLGAQAEAAKGYDAELLKTRAEALRKEAEIVERKADAKVQAIRDRARADVSALKAQ